MLCVSDPTASAEFYADVLGLETKFASPDAVFMASPASLTDHDLGLFRAPPERARPRRVGLYHLSWEVPTLDDLVAVRQRLVELGSYVGENNHGVSRSIYAHDPDGIEFEVMWELPIELMAPDEPRTSRSTSTPTSPASAPPPLAAAAEPTAKPSRRQFGDGCRPRFVRRIDHVEVVGTGNEHELHVCPAGRAWRTAPTRCRPRPPR